MWEKTNFLVEISNCERFLDLLVFPHLIRFSSFSPYYRPLKITLKSCMRLCKKRSIPPYYSVVKYEILILEFSINSIELKYRYNDGDQGQFRSSSVVKSMLIALKII